MSITLLFPSPFILLSAVLLLTACAGTKNTSQEPPTTVFLDKENQIHYDGHLNKEANERLFELYETSITKPDTLVISSSGGGVMLGMDLGDWVYDNEINIVIDKLCASSCANYIFTAGKQKSLKKDSIIIWHGSSWQKNIDALVRDGNKSIVDWRKREVSFFKKIEVDYRITVYGFGRYSLWQYIKAVFTAEPILGFDYSVEDMGKFGITNVHLVDGHWSWRKYTNCCNVKRVKLSDGETLSNPSY